MPVQGIHHVSAITKEVLDNHDFYTQILGLRLVKKTVNQDDTAMYHLFYGDYEGTPGTDITFFEISGSSKFQPGTNSISRTIFRVPTREALEYFKGRLREKGVHTGGITDRAGRPYMNFSDLEGQRLALIVDDQYVASEPFAGGGIPEEYAITGIKAVEITVQYLKPMVLFLEMLGGDVQGGWSDESEEVEVRFGSDSIFVTESRSSSIEKEGYGSVHHFALRVPDETALEEVLDIVNAEKWRNSGIVDRFYFKSIYIKSIGNLTIEIATDTPGFTVDERPEALGESLSLPPELEKDRDFIELYSLPIN
ncbi:VOC family protein [Lacicoccus alkaliphilus]|uniref:Glyoxalase family protein n=1 Tax=Lacicoccus alkaliphilus DSM 16010 TaxID=1123231 RepID=A0A1M7IHZ8_9BACL|nr:VOC family protein [Salinicoccus alkaliphilus]SHM40203.1 glyoxalase family protein [Salinicoccus alkaliphilus DSM 16010]